MSLGANLQLSRVDFEAFAGLDHKEMHPVSHEGSENTGQRQCLTLAALAAAAATALACSSWSDCRIARKGTVLEKKGSGYASKRQCLTWVSSATMYS